MISAGSHGSWPASKAATHTAPLRAAGDRAAPFYRPTQRFSQKYTRAICLAPFLYYTLSGRTKNRDRLRRPCRSDRTVKASHDRDADDEMKTKTPGLACELGILATSHATIYWGGYVSFFPSWPLCAQRRGLFFCAPRVRLRHLIAPHPDSACPPGCCSAKTVDPPAKKWRLSS